MQSQPIAATTAVITTTRITRTVATTTALTTARARTQAMEFRTINSNWISISNSCALSSPNCIRRRALRTTIGRLLRRNLEAQSKRAETCVPAWSCPMAQPCFQSDRFRPPALGIQQADLLLTQPITQPIVLRDLNRTRFQLRLLRHRASQIELHFSFVYRLGILLSISSKAVYRDVSSKIQPTVGDTARSVACTVHPIQEPINLVVV